MALRWSRFHFPHISFGVGAKLWQQMTEIEFGCSSASRSVLAGYASAWHPLSCIQLKAKQITNSIQNKTKITMVLLFPTL